MIWILLAVFLFILLIFFLHINVGIGVVKKPDHDPLITIRVLFFELNINPLEKRPKKKKQKDKSDLHFYFYLLKNFHFTITEFTLFLGIEEADALAMLCGFVHMFFYSIVSVLKNVQLKNHNCVAIVPMFNKNLVELRFHCIIKVRLRHIIVGYIFKKRK